MLKSFFIEGYKRARSHAVTTRGKYKSKAELNGFGIVHIVNGFWFKQFRSVAVQSLV